ncbi:TPA: CotH kinase family protein, partial [Klebsiella pneumoniae]|nr:CotH kinase family protein [Klebsiella pneumoniae]
MAQRYNTGNQRPSNSMKDLNDNALANDDYMNSEADTFIDRLGDERDTLRGSTKKMLAAGAAVVEETRQNLIPLSRQYMTLEAAQADIANIPEGSTTYVRSTDGSSLADEYINNAGTLQPTGRKMPSQQAVDDIAEQTQQATDGLQRIYLAQQLLSCAVNDLDTTDQIISETLQRLVVSQQVIAEGVNELSQLPDTAEDIQLHTLYAISVLGGQMVPLDGIDPSAKGDQSGQLATLMAFSVLVNALTPLDGFNPSASGGGSGDAGSPLRYPGIYAFGEPRGLVRIDLTSPSGAPTSKDDAIKGSVRIDIDGEVFSAYCLLSVQGATSAAYPKKNMSIELYPDATYAKTVSLKIGDVLPHEEWVFKANWIDSTHVRNTLCYNLWDKVVETRRSWPKREIDNTYIGKTGAAAVDTGATGHPKGYACITYLNGDFYGIGDLMIGKKRKNYNIAKNEATQILIGFDGAVNIP